MPSNNPDEPTSCSLSEPTSESTTSDIPNILKMNSLPGWLKLPSSQKTGYKLTPSLLTSLSHSVCLQAVLMKLRTEFL